MTQDGLRSWCCPQCGFLLQQRRRTASQEAVAIALRAVGMAPPATPAFCPYDGRTLVRIDEAANEDQGSS